MSEADDYVERLKEDMKDASIKDFENRLEILTILYAWALKEYEKRYPFHFRVWDTKQGG